MWPSQEIRAFRLSLGLTQEKFARLVNVTTSTVNRWEKGLQYPSDLAIAALDRLSEDKEKRA